MGWVRKMLGLEDDDGVTAGNAPAPDPLSGFSSDEIDSAALRLVHSKIPRVFRSYLGGTLADADRALGIISGLRTEYATFEPRRMRRQVMEWLDYFEGDILKTRHDIETQKSKRELDVYRAQNDAHFRRVDDIIAVVKNR